MTSAHGRCEIDFKCATSRSFDAHDYFNLLDEVYFVHCSLARVGG